jgi:hypothetical protein
MTLLYVASLRFKAGERQGVQRLAPDVARFFRPHFIIPPLKDRDPAQQTLFTAAELSPVAGQELAGCWHDREAYLDVRFLFPDFGEESVTKWLPNIFRDARARGARPIPVATLQELEGGRAPAYFSAIDRNAETKLALRVPFDAVSRDMRDNLHRSLKSMLVRAEDCSVLVDFDGADFSNPEITSGVIEGVIEDLQSIGAFQHIVAIGSSYPTTNPAEAGKTETVPRNEWRAWRLATNFGKDTPEQFVFGDYAADCSKIDFEGSGGRAIRHYRYTTQEDWLIVRGNSEGADTAVMQEVCSSVVNSGHFAGRQFSSADNYVFLTHQGQAGPGNSTNWREMNTCHHITRVVRDIGTVKGLTFVDGVHTAPPEQLSLLGL